MVKVFTQEHVYKHPWERVTSAFWRKFTDPENRQILIHILEVDTLNRNIDPESGKLYTTPLGHGSFANCSAKTSATALRLIVDAQSRSMQLTSHNISFQRFVEVEERIFYNPQPENPREWTCCRQETSINIKPLTALASVKDKVEQQLVEKTLQNSAKGRDVMERICRYHEAESSRISI